MYKYEMHAHTSEVSRCGRLKATEIIQLYKSIGYKGVVITDHLTVEYFDSLFALSWEEKVDCFLEGYKEAKKTGDEIGIHVLLGAELGKDEGDSKRNDFLLYGITESFLKNTPDLFKMDLEHLKSVAEKEGIMIYQAHPLRPSCRLVPSTQIHGAEVYNGNPRHFSNNTMMQKKAEERNLLPISGSDCHQPGDEGRGGIMTRVQIKHNKDLIQVLENQQYEMIYGS